MGGVVVLEGIIDSFLAAGSTAGEDGEDGVSCYLPLFSAFDE